MLPLTMWRNLSIKEASFLSIKFSSRTFSELKPDIRELIDKAINKCDVAVFMKGTPEKPMCGFSSAVCKILQIEGVNEFSAVNVLEDENIRTGIKKYTSWPTIPQVFVKGEFLGGCDILMDMHRSGELRKLLLEEKIVDDDSEK